MVILSHSSCSTFFISGTVVTRYEPRRRCILLFINNHIHSIGLKSGEFDTQVSLGIPTLVPDPAGELLSYGP